MSHWIEYLINQQPIKAIYGSTLPSLKSVDIHSVILDRDGPKLSILLNLQEYPDSPPKKWEIQKFNTVQISLSLIDLMEINISGWTETSYVTNLSIIKNHNFIDMEINENTFKLIAKAKFLDVESITAYRKLG